MRFAIILTLYAIGTYFILDIEIQFRALVAVLFSLLAEIIATLYDINNTLKNKNP